MTDRSFPSPARTLALLFLALLPLAAQNGSCTQYALQLQVGYTDWLSEEEPTIWDCTTNDLFSGRFKLTAPEGVWVFILPYLQVHTDDPALQTRLNDFLLQFPWLTAYDAPATEIDPNDPSLQSQPGLKVDVEKIQGYIQNCIVPVFPAYPQPSDQVRLWCQPVLDHLPQESNESFVWTAGAGEQLAWQLGPDWSKSLADPLGDDDTLFSWWSLMQRVAEWQAPNTSESQRLLDEGAWLKEAIDLGLTMHVQAFGMIDPDPSIDPTNDPNVSPGLPSLDHLPQSGPNLIVSSPIPIPIIPALPLSEDPSRPGPADVLLATPGSTVDFTLYWLVPATFIHFPGPAGGVISRRVNYLSPGRVRAIVPPGAVSGPVHFTNPYGTTVGVTINPMQYLNPAQQTASGPPPGGPGGR